MALIKIQASLDALRASSHSPTGNPVELCPSGLLEVFIQAWWDKFSQNEVGVKELYGLIETKDMQLDLTGKDEKSRKTSLGKKLSNLKDNQIGDYRVTRGKTQRRAQQWKLVPLKS